MTVKCLSEVNKTYIADCFTAKTQTITELAYTFKRHRTTIVRVLEEQGIDPGIRRRSKRTKSVSFDGSQDTVPMIHQNTTTTDLGYGQSMVDVVARGTKTQKPSIWQRFEAKINNWLYPIAA